MSDAIDTQRLSEAGWREHARNGFMGLVGPLWSRREAERYVFGVFVTREHVNPAGMIHGGMIASLLDQSVSTAAWEATGRQPCVTVQLDTHFVAAVRPGTFIVARSRIVRQTGTLLFVQAELSVVSEIVATGAATIKVMRVPENLSAG
ncbi:PaaI family thioesterase [Paraburkholderia sp. Ac-20347]|uniref:PaaI family thioesterase n=1 Tax=Paraburkholderia sp. Ac-20347 TaxID=2703892 RepID=UPI0019824427|nr:PaaI family thioesterase [Paraburkholderia sp. Ac-20347]MBN3807685.1 PaaI family thioesterase [Paraburkholderia sp. Ac-20347]